MDRPAPKVYMAFLARVSSRIDFGRGYGLQGYVLQGPALVVHWSCCFVLWAKGRYSCCWQKGRNSPRKGVCLVLRG